MGKRRQGKQDPSPSDGFDLGLTPEQISRFNQIHLVCKHCRFAWDEYSPILGFQVHGGDPANGELVYTTRCPICGFNVSASQTHTAIMSDGTGVAAMTPAILAALISTLQRKLEEGEMTASDVADELEAVAPLARLGAWIRENQGSIGLVVAILALILQAVTAVQPAPENVSPDHIEKIISGVIEQVEERSGSSTDDTDRGPGIDDQAP